MVLKRLLRGLQRLRGTKKTAEAKPGPAPHPQPPHRESAPKKAAPRPAPARQRLADAPRAEPRSPRPPRADAPPKPRAPAAPWDPALHAGPPAEGKTRFQDLPICPEIQHAVHDLGFEYCTPIQAIALPPALAGRDVAGQAQTGTGKTAAFLITVFQHIQSHPLASPPGNGKPRALVIAPTRELVLQIGRDAEALGAHLPLHTVAVVGGQEMERQRRQLHSRPVDLLAATPGRLLDFQQRREISLAGVEILILDEADRMLDMGFIPDVRRIIHSTPPRERRQTLLFSATLSPEVLRLASQWTRDPVRLDVKPDEAASALIDQVVYIVMTAQKTPLLVHLLRQPGADRVLLFVNRRDTGEHVEHLLKTFQFKAGLISGALTQERRTKTLEAFREGRLQVLVATDVAGRGLHIDAVSHVINYNLPHDAEDYVHRIGRTGRAGEQGVSISFASEDEAFYLPDIEKFIGRELKCVQPDEAWLTLPPDLAGRAAPAAEPARRPMRRDGFRPGPRRGPRRR
jgi:ATP-dependent RNA helicase RhlB